MFKILFLILMILFSQKIFASSCIFSTAVPINFGVYNPLSEISTDTTALLNISCTNQSGSYQIALGPGRSGNVLSRKMYHNNYSLNYNLYIDAARTLIWGDNTNGTSIVAGSSTCNLSNTCNHIIYGRIPAHQSNAAVGNYTDTIMVTLNY